MKCGYSCEYAQQKWALVRRVTEGEKRKKNETKRKRKKKTSMRDFQERNNAMEFLVHGFYMTLAKLNKG